MDIASALIAGRFLATALGQLARGNQPAEAVAAESPESGSPQAGPASGPTPTLREILARYDVTDISPRGFSEMIQKLHQAGALTDEQFQELSLVRLDLDLDDVAPDENLNLIDYYADKLSELQHGLEDAGNRLGSPAGDPPPPAAVQRRLAWLQKLTAIQSAPDALGLDQSA